MGGLASPCPRLPNTFEHATCPLGVGSGHGPCAQWPPEPQFILKTQMEAGGEFGGGVGGPCQQESGHGVQEAEEARVRGSLSRMGWGSWLCERMRLEWGSVVTSQDHGSGAQEGC